MYREERRKWNRAEGKEARKAFREVDWGAFLRHKEERGWTSVIEFGCGLSTILFSRVFDRVVSFETNVGFMNRVIPQVEPSAVLLHWDNKHLDNHGCFNFAFVDGILPRAPQARAALEHADYIFIHDPGASGRDAVPLMGGLEEIDSYSQFMRGWKNG